MMMWMMTELRDLGKKIIGRHLYDIGPEKRMQTGGAYYARSIRHGQILILGCGTGYICSML